MKKISVLLFSVFLVACSSDDSSENSNQNGFTFNGTFYEIETVYINDENTADDTISDIGFNLVNKTDSEIYSGNDLDDLMSFYFDFQAVNLEETTYTDILDYDALINASLINNTIVGGTQILSDNEISLQANDINITIHDITSTTVNFTFSFKRTDGKIIAGQYDGTYLVP